MAGEVLLPVACIGVAGDGLAIERFPCVGWTGMGVAGDGFACGLGFVVEPGAAPGFAEGVDGFAIGPCTGALLCEDLPLRGW